MRAAIVLACGLVFLVAGVVIQLKAELWSTHQIAIQNGQALYQMDEQQRKAYILTSEELAVLGVILTSVAAFRWTSRAAIN